MKHRPRLKVGDVCKFSKRYARSMRTSRSTMVVLDFSGDSSEGHTRIVVAVSNKAYYKAGFEHARKIRIKRKDLWYTGYNINEKKSTFTAKANFIAMSIENASSPSQELVDAFADEVEKLHKIPRLYQPPQHKCTCPSENFSLNGAGCQCGGA